MNKLKEEVEMGQELAVVKTQIVTLVKDIVEKKELSEIAKDSLALVIEAVKNYQELYAEIKDPSVTMFAGVLSAEIAEVFWKAPAPAAVESSAVSAPVAP